MTLLLTFLGTGNYQACSYRLGDTRLAPVSETFFSVALARHLRPDRIISLQTEAAAEKHGPALASALAPHCENHLPVPIPEGKSEAELWGLFHALTDHIPEGCTLHLDITHGFRSLPMLGFIALVYLRVTRGITIGGIHYGAWEARDPDDVAPVFDLTPFLTLLDWTAAADSFLTTGSAVRLAGLLANLQQNLWKNADRGNAGDLPKKLKPLGACLTEASRNLLLLRTASLGDGAAKVRGKLADARAEAAAHASPFLEVLEPVERQIARFAGSDLGTLRELVAWLAERDHTAAAFTLASEWIISWAMVLCGEDTRLTDYKFRKPFSLAISLLENPHMEVASDETGIKARVVREQLGRLLTKDQIRDLAACASTIRQARNDLNHAGFNKNPDSPSNLVNRAYEVAKDLKRLPLP